MRFYLPDLLPAKKRVKVFVAGGDETVGAGTFYHASWMGRTCVLLMDVSPDPALLRNVNRLVFSGCECLVKFALTIPRGSGVFKILVPDADLGKNRSAVCDCVG